MDSIVCQLIPKHKGLHTKIQEQICGSQIYISNAENEKLLNGYREKRSRNGEPTFTLATTLL